MNKAKLKERLLQMQELMLTEFKEKIQMTHSMVDIDEDDTHDPEDLSHQYESGELEELFKLQLHRAHRQLEELKHLDFDPKSCAEPGAIVHTDKRNFILGFSTVPFDLDGEEYVGVSRSAPIYTSLQGKKVGQSFTFCGTDYLINSIN